MRYKEKWLLQAHTGILSQAENSAQNFLAEPSILPGLACVQGAIPNSFLFSTCKVIFTEVHSQAEDRDCNYLHIFIWTVITPWQTVHFNSKYHCCSSHLRNPQEACVKCSPVSHLNRTLVTDCSHSCFSVHKTRTSFHRFMVRWPLSLRELRVSLGARGTCWTNLFGSNPLDQSKVRQEVIARKGNRY